MWFPSLMFPMFKLKFEVAFAHSVKCSQFDTDRFWIILKTDQGQVMKQVMAL